MGEIAEEAGCVTQNSWGKRQNIPGLAEVVSVVRWGSRLVPDNLQICLQRAGRKSVQRRKTLRH